MENGSRMALREDERSQYCVVVYARGSRGQSCESVVLNQRAMELRHTCVNTPVSRGSTNLQAAKSQYTTHPHPPRSVLETQRSKHTSKPHPARTVAAATMPGRAGRNKRKNIQPLLERNLAPSGRVDTVPLGQRVERWLAGLAEPEDPLVAMTAAVEPHPSELAAVSQLGRRAAAVAAARVATGWPWAVVVKAAGRVRGLFRQGRRREEEAVSTRAELDRAEARARGRREIRSPPHHQYEVAITAGEAAGD